MTITDRLDLTIAIHVALLLIPRIAKIYRKVVLFFKSLSDNDLEIYRAVKSKTETL